MTESLLGLLIEFDEMGFAPTTVCADPEGFAVRWKEQLMKEIEVLKSENAALRERLEKAVELPFIPNDYHVEVWLAEKKQSVMDESVNIVIPVYVYVKCENNEAAEARLAELNGGNNDD